MHSSRSRCLALRGLWPALILGVWLLQACHSDPAGPNAPGDVPVAAPVVPAASPDGWTGPFSDRLREIDPTALVLDRDTAALATGRYRYQVLDGASPAIEAGDVIYGGDGDPYLRRVQQVDRRGDELLLQTTSAFPHEIFRGGTFALGAEEPMAPGQAALVAPPLSRSDTFDLAPRNICQMIADSTRRVLSEVCGKDKTVIDKGWIEIDGRLDSLAIDSGTVVVDASLNGTFSIDPGGQIVPGTGRAPTFYPCNVVPNATGCLARVGVALRTFLQSVGVDPNVLPPLRVCVPGTPIVVQAGSVFPARLPVVRRCRITDWGALPHYTQPALTSLSMTLTPKLTIGNVWLNVAGSGALKLTIPIPSLAIVKCVSVRIGFLCLKAGLVVVANAAAVDYGGAVRFDALEEDRVTLTWTAQDGWRTPSVINVQRDVSPGYIANNPVDTVTVRIGPAAVLEANICLGREAKSTCRDETTGKTPTSSDSTKHRLLDLKVGAGAKVMLGNYLEGTWSRDTVFDNWHMPIDNFGEIEAGASLTLPRILIKPDKGLKASLPPFQYARTTLSSLHGTGILQVNTQTIAPLPGMADYTVTLERADTLPILQPQASRLGLANWEHPDTMTTAPNGSITFQPSRACTVVYSDALFSISGGPLTALAIKGARRLGLNVPNYQAALGCDMLVADYTVGLEGVPDQCVVQGGAQQPIRLTQEERALNVSRTKVQDFTVDCSVPAGPPGDLQVTVATTGTNLPTRYQLRLDGAVPDTIPIDTVATMTGVTARSGRVLTLEGVPPNCVVSGGNPLLVDVLSNQQATARFDVDCQTVTVTSVQAGAIQASASTVGTTLDPNGYTLMLDGVAAGTLATNGQANLGGLTAGQHVLALGDVDPGCVLAGASTRTVQVPSGGTITVDYAIDCGTGVADSMTGTVHVTVQTTGTVPDPDGYRVDVASFIGSIGVNDTLSFTQLAPGPVDVTLDDLAPNCVVVGTNPQSVVVSTAAITPVTIAVRCDPYGSMAVRTITSGPEQDPNGYRLLVNGNDVGPIPTTSGWTKVTQLAPGTNGIGIGDVAPNCHVVGPNPITLDLQRAAPVGRLIYVDCVPMADLGSLTLAVRMLERGTAPLTPLDVLIDGVRRDVILIWGRVVIPDVAPGDHTLELTNLPAGWHVDGGERRDLRFLPGAHLDLTLKVYFKPGVGGKQ